ncbi:MAG: hypothetical protein KC589_09895 [Nanoarchaeota archaeon]|nr:hypothetical protein [Nanoarchaeota archaeon]
MSEDRLSRAEHLIKFQELYYDRLHIDKLTPLTSRNIVMVKILLYALFDLTEKKEKKYFNQKEIMDQMTTLRDVNVKGKVETKLCIKPKYKMYVMKKIKLIVTSKYQHEEQTGEILEDINEEIETLKQKLFKINYLGFGDYYLALQTIFPIFISKKYYIGKRKVRIYYLNQHGKELMKLVKESNMLI